MFFRLIDQQQARRCDASPSVMVNIEIGEYEISLICVSVNVMVIGGWSGMMILLFFYMIDG